MAQIIKPGVKTLALNQQLATRITQHTQKATMTSTTKVTVVMTTTATKIRITVEAAEKIINK